MKFLKHSSFRLLHRKHCQAKRRGEEVAKRKVSTLRGGGGGGRGGGGGGGGCVLHKANLKYAFFKQMKINVGFTKYFSHLIWVSF